MRIARLLPLLALGLWFLAVRAPAEEGKIVGVEVKLWNPEASMKFKSSTDEIEGTDIDVEEDLDLDTTAAVPYIKIWFGGKHRVAASAMRLKFDGEADLEEEIVFDGETYNVGDTVKTDFTIDLYRLAWEADWISTKRMRIGTILGIDLFDVSASIEDRTTDLKEEEDFQAPVPVVGLLAEVQIIWGFSAYGEAAGMYVEYGGVMGRLIEAEAGLKYDIFGYGHVSAGWRLLDINIEDDDNEFGMTFSGLVVGVGARF